MRNDQVAIGQRIKCIEPSGKEHYGTIIYADTSCFKVEYDDGEIEECERNVFGRALMEERLHLLEPEESPIVKYPKVMLVYQGGLANVFSVRCFNLSDFGRSAQRLFQGDFLSAKMMAFGMGTAGSVVRSAACNEPGDITHAHWKDIDEDTPFRDRVINLEMN